MLMIRPRVSVVIPAHNEAANLPTLIAEILAAAPRPELTEIVVVDDGSDDATPTVLAELAERHGSVRPIRLQRRSGQSAALAAGFDACDGTIIVTMDADLQNDPSDIPVLLSRLDEGADAAVGWRKYRKDTWIKRITSRVANAVRNWLTSETVHDTGCGLKAFRRECLEHAPRFDGWHRFFPTLIKMQGFALVEVVVNHRARRHGRTHYGFGNRLFRPIMDLLAVRWLQSRTLRYEMVEEPVVVHA